jgi:3'(2'), 5'-bisphosphate nucleotidase
MLMVEHENVKHVFSTMPYLSLLAAKKAGEAILEVYQGDIHVSYKNDKTPLTLADETAHKVIGKHLSSI